MCGICGVVYNDRLRSPDREMLRGMRDVLTHRGPDDAGYYSHYGIGLGSRRLAILDLSERGHMPMCTDDGRYWITYNGEIYNYQELRASLEARGHVFRSNTDTEVLLYLYADAGPSMLPQLNGMFAFAIWDSASQTLFAARDRLGIKPFYYALHDDRFCFASEQKALFAVGVPAEFDPNSWEELMLFRYVAGEGTPFSGIKRLLPGHYLLWHDASLVTQRWWNLAERAQELRQSRLAQPAEWFRETFDASVNLRRISDVPVGVLLSGGLDSSSIAASLSAQAGSGVSSFTVRFEESEYDEGPLARQVAKRWQLDHHELSVAPTQLLDRLRKASWLNDEPLVHGNDVHLHAISEYAKPYVTVLLSGEGADETLGGYVRYQPLHHPALINLGRHALPFFAARLKLTNRLRKLSAFLDLGSIDQFVLYNACNVLPADLCALGMNPDLDFCFRAEIVAEARNLYPGEPVRQAMYSDQHTFLCSILDRNDRMTMGASIECRVPFLDYRLVEQLAALPSAVLFAGSQSKSLLRNSIGARLPRAILDHRKWGFGVPWNGYLRQVADLRRWVAAIPDVEPIRSGPFSRSKLHSIVGSFLAGDNRNEALVKQLLMIAIWYDSCIANPQYSRIEPLKSSFSN